MRARFNEGMRLTLRFASLRNTHHDGKPHPQAFLLPRRAAARRPVTRRLMAVRANRETVLFPEKYG
jgi:hypothetical protein